MRRHGASLLPARGEVTATRPADERTSLLQGGGGEGLVAWTPPKLRLGEVTFDWSRTYLMGVLNVTPDSFFDGGRFSHTDAAVAQGCALAEAGADLIDVGGESTRPGAGVVDATEERRRVTPVIERLRRQVAVPISVDTYKAEVALAAIEAGATLVNDISGGALDPEIVGVCARAHVPMVLGHLRGRPATMQERISFVDVVIEVAAELRDAVEHAAAEGVATVVDPGIGFGKSADQCLELIRRLAEVRGLCRRPVCVGPSRKSFLGSVTGLPVEDRMMPSAAAAVAAVLAGSDLVRIHDVAALRPAIQVADALRRGPGAVC